MKTRLLLFALLAISFSLPAQTWTQKSSFSGGKRWGGCGAAVNGKAYFGLGWKPGTCSDWWEYDPAGDTWTQEASLPGTARGGCVAQTANGKIYAGLGMSNVSHSDWWEYDPTGNTWTAKTSMPVARQHAFSFTDGTNVFVGTGSSISTPCQRDCWKYVVGSDTWTPIDSFPGAGREQAFAFFINGKAYAGMGSGFATTNDMYAYEVSTDTWTPITAYPGLGARGQFAFTIGGSGYAGGGLGGPTQNDFWRYNVATNTWTAQPSLPDSSRGATGAFTIGNKGYICTGYYGVAATTTYLVSTWEFSGDITGAEEPEAEAPSVNYVTGTESVFISWPSQPGGKRSLHLYSLDGKLLGTENVQGETTTFTLPEAHGIYLLVLEAGGTVTTQKLLR